MISFVFVFQKAILEAKSIEEVERLKALLQAGQMPNSTEQKQHQNGHKPNPEAMEQDGHSGNQTFDHDFIQFFVFLGNNMMEI